MSIDSSNKALTISKDSSAYTDSVTSVVFRLNTNDSSVYDTMTIVKLYDIADLEIGGRNLISKSYVSKNNTSGSFDSSTNTWNLTATAGAGGTWGCGLVLTGKKILVPYGKTYVLSFEIKVPRTCSWNADVNNYAASGSSWSGNDNDNTSLRKTSSKSLVSNQWVKCWVLWSNTHSSNTDKVDLYDNTNFGIVMKDETSDMTFQIRNIKGELGTVPADWTPAPEDVDKNINDVKDSLNSFQNTVNTSFKDGIIEQAEAKAIAQHLKTLDAEKADIDKEYSAIYSNANLTGSAKTNLASAKTSFDSAHASLKSTINTVISDGKVTSSESASVTSTFNTYNTQLGVYKQRVQEALDNISSGKVDKVEIGGRNLARKGSVVKYNSSGSATTVNDANFTTDGSATISRTAVTNEGAMIDRYVVYDGGANYVAAFKMRTTSGTVNSIHIYNGRGHKNSKVYIDGVYKGAMGQDLTFPNDTNYHKVEVRFEAVATDSSIANAQNTNHIIPQPMKGTASAYTIQILNLKIEKGNKATDWTPAPEDVKNHAEQSAQDAVNAQTQNSIFNKLTNNGQTQGIYLENSKIYINGEYIKANTLSADKVLVGDYTNYCQLTEQTPMSDKFNKYTYSDNTIWHEMKTINRDTRISRDYSCKGGEKFRVTGYVYGKVTSTTSGAGSTTQENTKFRVAIFGDKIDGSKFWLYGDNETGSSTGNIVQFNKIITLPSNAKSFYVALQIDGYAPFSGVARCRNIEVRRMNTGELIVDGSITAKSLHADVLSANSIVSTINGGSTNISGNKIRTGTIQSNNGKSTINLDNGSMNLGATSDASYLQWTGSALNIKANSINIGTSSVATTTQLTEKIDGIQVGIRNLARPTSGDWASKTGFNGGENQTWYPTRIYLDTLSVGDEITYSYDIEYSGITVNNGSSTFRLALQGAGNSTGWNTALPSKGVTLNIGSGSTRISHTFKLTAEQKKNSYFEFGFRTDHVNGGTIKYRCGMASKGNKVVQWTPAPEDVNTAINNKANSADVYKKSEVYTKTETNTQITTAKNEINQSVSSTYETKTNVTNKINNLTVSATNLLDNSAPLSTNGWVNWSGTTNLTNNLEITTTDNSTHGKQGKITFGGSATGTAGPYKHPVQKLTSGKSYSWSIWLRSGSGNLEVRVGQEQNGLRTVTVGTSWTRFTHTYTANDSSNYAFIIRPTSVSNNSSLYFHSIMLVEGDKPVAWQTSPTEVLSDKTSIEKRVTSAESKITDTAITNTVKKNFYTKEETNNQITSKGYQTASQVQQTVNNLQIKFAESGGYNLFLNSGFKKNMSYWGTHTHNSPTGGSIGITTSAGEWGFPDASVNCVHIRLSNQSGIEYGISQAVKTTIGKKYTISFYYAGHRLNNANLIVRNSNGSWLASKAITSFPSGGNGNANNWNKHTLTFTANATSHTINIAIVNAGSDGYMWIAKPQVVEGELDLPYSPNPSEVYDGIIQMDKDGIKVSTSNGGWTDFTSLGMNVYNRSSKLSLGTRNGGLTYHGGGQYLGFTSESIVEAYNTRGVSISTANGGAYITLGHSSATDPFGGFTSTPCLSVAKQDIGDSSSFYRQGVNVHTTLNLNTQHINRMGTINFATNNTSKIYESTVGNLCMFGDNGAVLGYREGNNNVTKLEILEGSDKSTSDIHSYAHWRFHQWSLTDVGQIEVVSRLKMLGTSSIHFNANATHPSAMWHASGDGKLKIFGDNGVDIGYREGDTNRPIFQITEGEDGAYRIKSFSHWHFNNWNLDYVGNVHAQKFSVAGTSGAYYITKGTGDGADYTTYGCLFYTHNGLAFTANGGAVTLVVQGRSGRIMGKNAYYVNSSKCLKSDIRAVTSESEPMPVNLKQGEVVDETLTMEMIGDFIDTIGIRTYITDFEQEGATQKDVDPQQGHVLNLGYIADDLAHHPVFKYIGEKTPDNLYAINSNSLTTVALAGLQAERKERRKLEQRLQQLEAMLLKGEE